MQSTIDAFTGRKILHECRKARKTESRQDLTEYLQRLR